MNRASQADRRREGNQPGGNAVMRYPVTLLMLGGVFAVASFTVSLGHGEPLLDWQRMRDHWSQPDQWLTSSRLLDGGGAGRRVYRWRDATGSWQYGQIPPPGVDVQTVEVEAPTIISAEEMRGEGSTAQGK